MKLKITPVQAEDILEMVRLSGIKRQDYETHQPRFWRRAESADSHQERWFHHLLNTQDHILLLAKEEDQIIGFVIGRLIEAPAIYAPGGLTLMIDDFCVASPQLWLTAGQELLKEISSLAKKKGSVQTVVVTGAHDTFKKEFLKSMNMTIASEWYVSSIQ